jgi:hypothetical protein
MVLPPAAGDRASRPQLRAEAEVDYLIDRYCAVSYTTYSLYAFVS